MSLDGAPQAQPHRMCRVQSSTLIYFQFTQTPSTFCHWDETGFLKQEDNNSLYQPMIYMNTCKNKSQIQWRSTVAGSNITENWKKNK